MDRVGNRATIMETTMDLITAQQRLGSYTTKTQKIRKIYGGILLILVSAWFLTAIGNHLVDQSIKSTQLRNLTLYHDVNGFKPVK